MHGAERSGSVDVGRRWVPRRDPRAAGRYSPGAAGARPGAGCEFPFRPRCRPTPKSLALTVTSDRALAPGFLTVHGCGSSLPELSNVNVRPEGPTSNLAVVAIDATRQTCIFSDRGTDLIVDLVGWFGPGRITVPRVRAAAGGRHSRARRCALPASPVHPSVGQFVEIPRSMLGVPDEADAVVVNLTVTQATGYGYLTAFPCGGDPPNTSNVNYNVGVDRANASIMALGPQGSLCVRLVGIERPRHRRRQRLVRRRRPGSTTGRGTQAHRRFAQRARRLDRNVRTRRDPDPRSRRPNLPAGSRVAVLGVVSTVSSAAGFITVQPCGGQAEVSNLNFVGGVDITNLAVVPLADDGTICVTSSARTHIVVDVFGGFGDGGLARELSIGRSDDVPRVLAGATRLHRLLPERDRQPAVGARARHAAHARSPWAPRSARRWSTPRCRSTPTTRSSCGSPRSAVERPTSTGSAAFRRTSRRSPSLATAPRRPAGTSSPTTATSRPTVSSG